MLQLCGEFVTTKSLFVLITNKLEYKKGVFFIETLSFFDNSFFSLFYLSTYLSGQNIPKHDEV